MSETLDGPVLAGSVSAAEFGSGTGGLLVVVLLGAVSIGLFVALSGSLRRMRANVESGQFSDPRRTEGDARRAEGDPRRAEGDGDRDAEQPKSAGTVPGQGRGPDGG